VRVQRVREAESRVEMQIVKWTAEGMVKGVLHLVFHDVTHTLVARGMFVSRREYGFPVNQGGTADNFRP